MTNYESPVCMATKGQAEGVFLASGGTPQTTTFSVTVVKYNYDYTTIIDGLTAETTVADLIAKIRAWVPVSGAAIGMPNESIDSYIVTSTKPTTTWNGRFGTYGVQALSPTLTLGDYGIGAGSTIYLVWR